MNSNILDSGMSVYLTSFWGWSPETWGTVGFTSPGRRDTIVHETTDPFIMVIYVTKNAATGEEDVDGKITGFYVVSHIEGHRNQFTNPLHHGLDAESWQYSLKAVRAFSFLPEYRRNFDSLYPDLKSSARVIAASGRRLDDAQIAQLKKIPYVEVPVYGSSEFIAGDIVVPDEVRHMVKPGPVNRSGYTISGEPPDTEKELYALVLDGDTAAFLGRAASGQRIYKIGLSISPKARLEAFRNTLPKGAFEWRLHRSTRQDGHEPYPSFEAAVTGETAMKQYLGRSADCWLGGEFYTATEIELEGAWQAGRAAALGYGSVV